MIQLFDRYGVPFKGKPATNDKGQAGYFPGWRICGRCGGAGGSDKWAHTGWKCFDCQNANHRVVDGRSVSVIPSERFVRLYTADHLERLNAIKAKADATRARKAAERAATEAERVERERAAVIKTNAQLIGRIAALVDVNEEGFLAQMHRQIVEQARPLSDKQIAAAEKCMDKMEAENARRAAASHLGQIGERREFELEYLRHIQLSRAYEPLFIIWVFRCGGSSVVYKGGSPVAFEGIERERKGEPGDQYWELVKGSKIKVVATVKEHTQDRRTGEPETVIQRPKAVEKVEA